MQFEIGMTLAQQWPFSLRLLHTVLAEAALTGRDCLFDRMRWHRLADGNESHRRGIAAGAPRRVGDVALDRVKAGIPHDHFTPD
jgi:hypothetical protein